MQFFNLYGVPVIVILFIVWMIFRNIDKKYKPPTDSVNRGLKGFEQIGGFAVIFLMVCGFGIQGDGFLSDTMKIFWIVSMVFLLLLHILSYIMFYRSRNHTLHMLTAIFPSVIFILTGLLEQDPPLLLFAIVFAIGKIYMTSKSEI